MKKSDLKNGMIVELRNGDMCIVVGDKILDTHSCMYVDSYDYDLIAKCELDRLDIVRVYKNKEMESLSDKNDKSKLKLIWQRDEIDWSKVPFGTKVRVWDFENDARLEGKFLGYNEEHTHPYNVFVGTNEPKIWRNCELIEEPVTYEELKEGFKKHCDDRNCMDCKYKTNNGSCRYAYILQNYNVTRK